MASWLMQRFAAIACATLLAALVAQCATAQAGSAQDPGSLFAATTRSEIPQPLTLSAALGIARRIHPDLRVAGANLAILRADSAYARVPALNPVVDLQTARGGQTLGSGSEATLGLGVSQELELWGKRGARQSVTTARSRTGAAEWSLKLQEIESDVRARFERAHFLQDRLETLEALANLDRRVVAAAQARVRDGSMTPVTGRLTELDLLRLVAQGHRARADLRQALITLSLSIGQELPDSTRLSGALQADSLEAPEELVVALAMSIRGTGEVLRRQIAERQADLQLAQREARPGLTLGLGLTKERRSFSKDNFTGDPAIVGGIAGAQSTDNLWTARVSAPLPLWQRNQAARARASAEIVRSQAEYDRYRLRTQLEVRGAVLRFQDATALYRLYLDRSTRVRQDLVLIREAYADGRISLDSYLTQKARLVDTLLGQLEAAEAYWDARGELESAVGLDLAHLNAGGAR